MVVRRFSIAEVLPVYVPLSPSCFWLCPTSAPTRNPLSAVTRRFLVSSKFVTPGSKSEWMSAPHKMRRPEREKQSFFFSWRWKNDREIEAMVFRTAGESASGAVVQRRRP